MIREKFHIQLRILYIFFFFIIVKSEVLMYKDSQILLFWKLEDGTIKRNEEFCEILTSYARVRLSEE